MSYGSETWQVKEEDMKRLERNDARIIRWMCGISLNDKVPILELRNRMRLNSLRECMQHRRLQWFGHLEKMEANAWASKCRDIMVDDRLARGRPRKSWSEVVRKDLRDKNVSKDVAKDGIAWKSVITIRPTHGSMENGR